MNIRQLRYFVAAVRGGSLTAAARDERVTVQAVSKGITELEHEVGTPLLDRGNQGVRATAMGQALFRRAQNALQSFAHIESFAETARAQGAGEKLVVALCIPAFQGGDDAMESLSRFFSKQVGVPLEIIIAPFEASLDALRSHEIDALCTAGPCEVRGLSCRVIGSLPTGIGVPKDHPLARHRRVHLGDLAPYPVVRSASYDTFNRSILTLYLERGVTSPVADSHEDGTLTPPDTDRALAYSFMIYLPPFAQPFRNIRVIPIDPSDQIPAPVCLVSPEHGRAPGLDALEQGVGKLPRGF